MSYGVSDHKPVIATFSVEVGAESLSDSRILCSSQMLINKYKCASYLGFSFSLLSFSQLRKHFDTPMVHVSPVGVWSADQDALLDYTIQEDFMSSTWDWIGLYKVLRQM